MILNCYVWLSDNEPFTKWAGEDGGSFSADGTVQGKVGSSGRDCPGKSTERNPTHKGTQLSLCYSVN